MEILSENHIHLSDLTGNSCKKRTVGPMALMSGRVVSDIQTRAEGESLYIRYNTDANVVNGLKNDSSYEFIGEVILKISVV